MFARVWAGAMALKCFDPKEVYETAVSEGAKLRLAWSRFTSRNGPGQSTTAQATQGQRTVMAWVAIEKILILSAICDA